MEAQPRIRTFQTTQPPLNTNPPPFSNNHKMPRTVRKLLSDSGRAPPPGSRSSFRKPGTRTPPRIPRLSPHSENFAAWPRWIKAPVWRRPQIRSADIKKKSQTPKKKSPRQQTCILKRSPPRPTSQTVKAAAANYPVLHERTVQRLMGPAGRSRPHVPLTKAAVEGATQVL